MKVPHIPWASQTTCSSSLPPKAQTTNSPPSLLTSASPRSVSLEPVEITTSAQPHVHGISFSHCMPYPWQSGVLLKQWG